MSSAAKHDSIAVMVTHDGMGRADQALQHKLVSNWLKLIAVNDRLPGVICFYADGVRLVVEGSPVLTELRALEDKSVHLIVCKTCLEHFGLTDEMRVGIVGGMGDIIAAQWTADKVITL